MSDFKNKIVVITGAAGNLGVALCRRFAAEGALVVGMDLHERALTALSDYLQGQGLALAAGYACDLSDREACRAVFRAVTERFPQGVYALINNAGITHIQRFEDMDRERDTVRRVMEVNLLGAVYCTECVLDSLIAHKGMIINISSVAGYSPLLGRTAYAASKHALHGFFESLRCELAGRGVGCLMVCPSYVAWASPLEPEGGKSAIYAGNKKIIGTLLQPDYIAEQLFRAALRRRRLLILGRTGRLAYFMRRFFPVWYEGLMRRRLSKEL